LYSFLIHDLDSTHRIILTKHSLNFQMKIKWYWGFVLIVGTWARPNEESHETSRSFSLFSVVQFPNDECVAQSANALRGICRSADECGSTNGISDGNCASGFGVCCRHSIEGAAGSTSVINQNGTYVQNPNFPTPVTAAGVFTYSVMPSNAAGICQLRLDFVDVALTQPAVAAGCAGIDNIAIVAGGNLNPPNLCGTLDGEHIYVATGKQDTAATITVTKVGVANSHWQIRVRTIECGSLSSPPGDGCLQYHTGPTGIIKSFNSDVAAPVIISLQNNDINYNICIRQEAGHCTMNLSETRPGAMPDSFLLDNQADASNVCMDPGTCLIIDGQTFAGTFLNAVDAATLAGVVTANAPFLVHVRTTGVQLQNSLFDLTYRQIAC